MPVYILNLAYFLMLVGLTIRSFLALRLLLISAQTIFILYGMAAQNYILLFWNSIFLCINGFQTIALWRQRRPIKLPIELEDIYDKAFITMTKREFLYFWQMGKKIKAKANTPLIEEGSQQSKLFLILEGTASVLKMGKEITKLKRGDFVAEMSFLSRLPASADVTAQSHMEFICWEKENLDSLKQINPKFYSKLHSSLSKDVVQKLHQTNIKLNQ